MCTINETKPTSQSHLKFLFRVLFFGRLLDLACVTRDGTHTPHKTGIFGAFVCVRPPFAIAAIVGATGGDGSTIWLKVQRRRVTSFGFDDIYAHSLTIACPTRSSAVCFHPVWVCRTLASWCPIRTHRRIGIVAVFRFLYYPRSIASRFSPWHRWWWWR
jgi:hypothetical protein